MATALTDKDWGFIRLWVGDAEDSTVISNTYDLTGSVLDTVESVLRMQIRNMMSQAQSVAIPGAISVSYSDRVAALQSILKDFRSRGMADYRKLMGIDGSLARLYRPSGR